MPKDISELEFETQRLKVSWRKANNFFVSFSASWFELKKRFDSGEFAPWTFERWSFKIGLPERQVMKYLSNYTKILAAEHAEQVAAATAAQDRERLAASAERRRIREENRRKNRNERLEELKLRQAEEAAAVKSENAAKAKTKAETKAEVTAKRRAEKRAEIARRGPQHPRLRELLQASSHYQHNDTIAMVTLGHIYFDMSQLLNNPEVVTAEGMTYDGHEFDWNKFVIYHIEESPDERISNDREFVEKMIKHYEETLPPEQRRKKVSRDRAANLGRAALSGTDSPHLIKRSN
jgi:hypothetical protein